MSIRRYIKKPIVIEAIQYTADNIQDIFDFLGKKVPYTKEHVIIVTLEGEMKLKKGHYLIKGIEEEFYPCDEKIFKKSYEHVD